MSFLNFFAKKRPAPRGFQTQKTASKFQKTFILEPILTPSGIVDGGDDAPDLVMLEPPAELLEDVDFPEMKDDLVGDAPDWKVSEGEEISFFTPETETELTGNESVEDIAEELPLFNGNDYIPTFESGVFAVGDSGEVSFDFLFDGGRWEGEVAIFSLEGMDEFEPGSEGFIQEAASRALSDSELGHIVISDTTEGARFSGSLGEFYGGQEADWNEGDYRGVKTFSMRPGDEFGIMLVPKGTVEAVLDNPGIEGYQRPLFSMVTANPDDAFHVGQIADVVGDGTTFVMEDWRVDDGSDRDYNDIIFRVDGAKGYAALLDDVIASDNDWRHSELGQRVLSYVSEYDNPGKDVPGDPTYPGLPTPELPIPTVPQATVDQGGDGFSDLTGEIDETVEPNRGGALPNTPTRIEASATGDVIDQAGLVDSTDFYRVSSTQLVNAEVSVLSGNALVSIQTLDGEMLSQQVLPRGTHTLTVPEGVSGEVLLKFESQDGADATYRLKGFESQAREPFNIDVEFDGDLTDSQQEIVRAAAKSVESLIGQGLPNAIVDGKIIDDVNFKISVTNLDGAGGTLARTKIDFMRYGTLLPAQSLTQFDVADLAELENSGQLFSVVQHEILHGLGFGNLWEAKGLVDYAKTPFARYTGESAVAAFRESGGVTDYINLETEGDGSADLHWHEGLFQDELMTRDLGFQTGEEGRVFSPISTITLAALADLGYQVNLNGATPNWGLLGGTRIREEDLTAEQIEAFRQLAEEMEAQPASEIPIIVPAVDPSTIAPEIWAHAERFDLNGEYYDWELVTIQPGDTVSQYVFDRMTHPSQLDNRSRVVRANDLAYWQFVVDRNIALGVEDPHLIIAGRQIWLPVWNENYEQEREEERRRREEELRRREEEERRERDRQEEAYRQSGSGGLEWWIAKPLPDFSSTAPYETSVQDLVGSLVPDDYFRFNLSRPGYVTLYLEDLLADADLYLYDSRNRLIGKAEREGVTDEKIILELTPGTYLARVHSADGLVTDYNLKVRFDGLPSRTQIGAGGGGKPPGATFADPRIERIYTTALNQFSTAEREKANAQIRDLEAEKRQYEQELEQLLQQMNAEQRTRVHAALDGVRDERRAWVDSVANPIKDGIDSKADWILGQIDSKIPSQVYQVGGIGDRIRDAKDNLKGAINGARSWLKGKVDWVQTEVKNAIWWFIETLKNAYRTGAEINSVIEAAAQDLKGKIDGLVGGINNWVGEFKGKILGSVGWLRSVGVDIPDVKNFLGNTIISGFKWNFYDNVAEPLANDLANGIQDKVDSVANFAKGTVDYLKPRAQKVVADVLAALIGDETGHLYNKINGVNAQIAATRTELEQKIARKATELKNQMQDFLGQLGNEGKKILDFLLDFDSTSSGQTREGQVGMAMLEVGVGLLGTIPPFLFLDTALDIKDLVAPIYKIAFKKALSDGDSSNDLEVVVELIAGLAGFIPGVGNAIRSVMKKVLKLPVEQLVKTFGSDTMLKISKELRNRQWSAILIDVLTKILKIVKKFNSDVNNAAGWIIDLMPGLKPLAEAADKAVSDMVDEASNVGKKIDDAILMLPAPEEILMLPAPEKLPLLSGSIGG